MRKSIWRLSLLLIVSILAACGSDDSSDEPDDKLEGKITVYAGSDEERAIETMNLFTEETGIEVDMVRLSAGEILSRVRAESANTQADVWFGGPAETFEVAKEEELLEPYVSPTAEYISDEYKDDEGYWTGMLVNPLGFVVNQNFLDANGLEAPTAWEDLLDPAYEGEIVMPHPASSGTAYTVLYNILQYFDNEEEAYDYLEALDGQVQQYTTSGVAPARMVGMEEAGAGILFYYNSVKSMEEGFDNLEPTVVDGAGYELFAVAKIADAPNPELAEAFIDWVLGPAGQEAAQDFGNYNNVTHPEAADAEQAIELSDYHLIDFDLSDAAESRDEIIQKWENEIYDQ